MIEFYAEIRLAHVAAVIASGGLFCVRGLALAIGAGGARAAPLRYLSYSIDIVLLTAALMLTTILRQYPFQQSWLSVKVLLLAAYLVLAYIAFWKAKTRAISIAFWLAALAVYVSIVSVARAHHPLGFFHTLLA